MTFHTQTAYRPWMVAAMVFVVVVFVSSAIIFNLGWWDGSVLVQKGALVLMVSIIPAYLAKLVVQLRQVQRRLEIEERETTNRYRDIVDASADWVWEVDAQGCYTYVSDSVTKQLGYAPEVLLGKTAFDLMSPKEAARVGPLFAAIVAKAVPFRDLYNIVLHKDGRQQYTLTSGAPIFNAEGILVGYRGVDRDITDKKMAERALQDSEARYRTLFIDNKEVMLVIDPENGHVVDANRAAYRYYGYSPEEISLISIFDINTLSSKQVKAEMALAHSQQRDHFNFKHRLASGEVRDVEVSSGPINVDGRERLLSVIKDVTERHLVEAHMREAMIVFDASSQGIMTTDPNGLIRSVNPAFSAITGYSAAEAVGKNASILQSGRHDNAFYQTMWAALRESGYWFGEIWNRRKNGETYPEWMTNSAVRDEQGEIVGYIALFSDITQRKQEEEVIWHQANFDALTGLANRNLLHDRLERAMSQARRNHKKVGLVFIDLDGFKGINDTLGHDVGDMVLIEVARRIQACVREEDVAARLGGDEFTLVVQDIIYSEDLKPVGDKLLEVLRHPFTLVGGQHYLSGSVGITVFPDDAEDLQTLIRYADIAMYNAKEGGRNCLRFYASRMQEDAEQRMLVEYELRIAIRDGNFVLHYQPIIDAGTGVLVGAEALIRWQHPVRGLVFPDEFISVAEHSGLIVAIGEWVLREAAGQSQQWCMQGYPRLRMAVNVSGIQFRDDKWLGQVAAVIEEFGLEPGRLVLEITESLLMEAGEVTEEYLSDIKKQGILYAMDDFGTGFSSLSYLKRFPIDLLKIDRSFIGHCAESGSDAHLVKAIIQMAHSLQLKVVAEGVETPSQLAFLQALGCDYLQGYLIGKPVPTGEFERFFQRSCLLPDTDGCGCDDHRSSGQPVSSDE